MKYQPSYISENPAMQNKWQTIKMYNLNLIYFYYKTHYQKKRKLPNVFTCTINMPYCSYPTSVNRNTKMTCEINLIDYQCILFISDSFMFIQICQHSAFGLSINHFRLDTLTLCGILFQLILQTVEQSRVTHFFVNINACLRLHDHLNKKIFCRPGNLNPCPGTCS